MPPRFFAPKLSALDVVVTLPLDEAQHLRQVLRLDVGEIIHIFDGKGQECEATVEYVGRRDVRVRPVASVQPLPESSLQLTLAPAMLKGRQLDLVIRDATMLGVVAIQPLISTNMVVPAAVAQRGSLLDRWRRIAVSSAKQCGRAVVPEVRCPVDVSSLSCDDTSAGRVVLVEPALQVNGTVDLATLVNQGRPDSLTLAVGPEGGWTSAEIEKLGNAQFIPLTLGVRTLRAAAAPAVLIAALLSHWGEF